LRVGESSYQSRLTQTEGTPLTSFQLIKLPQHIVIWRHRNKTSWMLTHRAL